MPIPTDFEPSWDYPLFEGIMAADTFDELKHIHELADQLARELAELLDGTPQPERREVTAGDLRRIIRARRLRGQYLGADLFADPAWDMMVDLLAAKLEGRRVGITSLGIAADVPPTTALRWTKLLVDRGLLVRTSDPKDARRVFIELAPSTEAKLRAYFRAVQGLSDTR